MTTTTDKPTVDKVEEVITLRILVGVLKDHISRLEHQNEELRRRQEYFDDDDLISTREGGN